MQLLIRLPVPKGDDNFDFSIIIKQGFGNVRKNYQTNYRSRYFEVIRELYAEAEINAKDSVFGSGEIPDIQELLIDLNSENLETIEYFYCLCQEEKLIPDALRRYEDEVFPYLEDSIKMTLYNEGLMYRDSSRELDTVYNDRAIPCQNSLFMLGQINV